MWGGADDVILEKNKSMIRELKYVVLMCCLLLASCNKKEASTEEAENQGEVPSMLKAQDQFVDFSSTYKGTTQRLSDYVGKGKPVVADFWASWCGPCRGEIPYLIDLYHKYGDKIVVLGIATWDDPADTEQAIAELKIPYPQMMNAGQAGSDAYGIEGIPEIILFSAEGKILRRGLRGEAIAEAVEACLQAQP